MNILVTGGAGGIGRFASAYLSQLGHRVRIADNTAADLLSPEQQQLLANCDYRQIDIQDLNQLIDSCTGIDLIVHLAGIPHLYHAHSAPIFHINVGGTFNLYTAAARVGITRVIAASSINYLGNGFGKELIKISYFPIDEAHPGYSTDAYAFSKQMLEEVAAYFWRSAQISSICFRYPVVYTPLWMSPTQLKHIRQKAKSDLEWLMTQPKNDRMENVAELRRRYLHLRDQRSAEEIRYQDIFAFYDTVQGATLLREFDNFWAAINIWDAVRAIACAIDAQWTGYHPLYIAEQTNFLHLPTRQLLSLLYPAVTNIGSEISGQMGLLKTERAKQLIGFEPIFGGDHYTTASLHSIS